MGGAIPHMVRDDNPSADGLAPALIPDGARPAPSWSAYVSIARPSHWWKNVFVLPGIALAALLTHAPLRAFVGKAVVGFVSICLLASANYAINEWLDATTDRFHPLKRDRPAARRELAGWLVAVEYSALLATGLVLATLVSPRFLLVALVFVVMALVYNVPPLRTKDRAVLDVVTESVNSPLRLLLGWFIVLDHPFPPSSLLLGYWMAGGYLMTVKRYGELRFLRETNAAGQYRKSFRVYTEETLLISLLFYACTASFMLGVFLVKYRVQLVLCLPFLAVVFAWYLRIGLKPDSAAQSPERMYGERGFALYCVFVVVLLYMAFVLDVPGLTWFLQSVFANQ
jgi:decaprenyl-phosphate phosphoribosyltransferase